MYLSGLCFITDRTICSLPFEDMILPVMQSGVKWIQYRDKERSRREIYEEAVSLSNMIKRSDGIFIVNDHADIAIAVDADGVHLGQDDLPLKEARKLMGKGKIIGISTHSIEQAEAAERDGADYIGFGPVFHTKTKAAGSPKGLDMLREIRKHVHLPVIAIGGITLKNIQSVLEAGADAIAVASAILSGNIEENALRFMNIIKAHNAKYDHMIHAKNNQ
jgi:thiamine-phosphate pyrophosphorylase